MIDRSPRSEVGILRTDGLTSYECIVGNLKVTIDLVGETVCVYRTDEPQQDLVTQEMGNGFLIDRAAIDRDRVVGVEVIS